MSFHEQEKELEPEQAAAAHALGRHISVIAGPGAGKTKVLVERYVHILRKHSLPSIDQIVAITFTNRAANEMRERLRKRLDKLLQEASGEDRQRWMRFKRTLDGAVITTIHGFCMRLLREFPVEAQLDPQFMLLDEHRAATLLHAAVEESLTEFISRGDEPISRLTAGVGRPRLATALFQMYLKVRGQGMSLDSVLKQTTASHSRGEDHRVLCNELEARMADLISTRGLTGKAAEKRSEAKRRWPRLREQLLNEELPLADYCGLIAEFREAARPKAQGPVASLVKRLDELFWGKTNEKPFGRLPQLRFDLFSREYSTELIKLLKSIDQRFLEKKQQLSALDFDDLQIRTLQLLGRPEVIQRASRRYKFFLVDEFQDTNGLQRDLMDRLALKSGGGANLFIVGDRKQSIYGFRGADVDVFAEMNEALIEAGGESMQLPLNFRSQPPLIDFFNFLFARLFTLEEENGAELDQLGYVEHEPSVAKRAPRDRPPLVELMIDMLAAGEEDPKAGLTPRERDAKQLAQRIISFTESPGNPPASIESNKAAIPVEDGRDSRGPSYRDIALLFRAMTDVPVYEVEFRRAGIPYQTVLGKGFYEREEITDLIQLCRFLDNRTDDLALAAVLRSPLGGISDNALLALRLAPRIGETPAGGPPQPLRHPRPLFKALQQPQEIDFIADDERAALERATEFLVALIERRNRYSISDLLRFAVEKSEYTTVIAATFDGAQRLANIEKLFTLAERFERSGAHLIRDFVQYVQDFEVLGSRESEGQFDDSVNAVKLMTIHQAKGLEFPIVIIPDLHRSGGSWEDFFVLDRHRGLTVKVPDGRGQMAQGRLFTLFSEQAKLREKFESMRLLYVAATRAQARLILSGAIKDLAELVRRDSWLRWVWQVLDLGNRSQSSIVAFDPQTQLQLTVNLIDGQSEAVATGARATTDADQRAKIFDVNQAAHQLFPLMRSLEPEPDRAVHRFSVTQLINYRRCPRQYYFDRVLNVPTADEMAVWNDAEAAEPPANLTATLKGAVIHRFCETFCPGDELVARLHQSLQDLIRLRQARFADRLLGIDAEKAVAELLPLAEHYLGSDVFRRINEARAHCSSIRTHAPANNPGLWSELGFRLRRPMGILTGAIDKLLITPSGNGRFDIEIIDFKTNRLRPRLADDAEASAATRSSLSGAPALRDFQGSVSGRAAQPAWQRGGPAGVPSRRPRNPATPGQGQQFAFDFSTSERGTVAALDTDSNFSAVLLQAEVARAASDYQLQMQAYALAARELLPSPMNEHNRIKVTLHFLDPNVEYSLPEELLEPSNCSRAIDEAITEIISAREPRNFPVRPANHCRMCNFLVLCSSGREWLRQNRS